MRKTAATLVTLSLVAVLTGCITTGQATTSCLERPTVVQAVGMQQYPRGYMEIPSGSGIDARGASWAIQNSYPVSIQGIERLDLCMVGGYITSLYSHETTPWSDWHRSSALTVKRPGFQALQTRMHNVGDGARFTGTAPGWTMRGVHMTRVHDDCIENDGMQTGAVDDSFFDGCYVFYSARGGFGTTADGSGNTFTLANSLVRLEHMPSVYNGDPGGGHGPFFKLSVNPNFGRSPRMVIRNTVFRVDEHTHNGTLGIPAFDHDLDPATPAVPYLAPEDCSGNTVVWLGEGPYPDPLPDCFTITTDPAVWDRAVDRWHANRP